MHRKSWTVLFTLVALVTAPAAHAAFITTHEAELEALFAGNGLSIDVRYLPSQQIVDPGLLSLTDASQFQELLALPGAPSPTISLLFIDNLEWCGVSDPNLVGCAELPGHRGVVESVFAGSALGDELVAHEIGHMFGLTHVSDPNRLMDPIIYGGTLLTSAEQSTILASPLIQNDGVDYIEILPILAVPEPGVLALWALGGWCALRRRAFAARGARA